MTMNFGYTLEKRARMTPDIEAIIDVASGRRFTFAEFDERANRTGNALRDVGVGKGDRVGILAMNCVEFCETFFAVAKIGAICVPLNWRLTAEELEFILRDSGVSLLLFGPEFASVVEDLQARPILNGQGEGASTIRTYWQIGGETLPFASDYDANVAPASPKKPPSSAGGDDDLFIMYTSGTTGLPKGVVHTHDTCTWCNISILSTWESRIADRFIIALPMFHVGALGPMAGNVYRGMTSLIVRSFDPAETWRMIERERITSMIAVPAMLLAMYDVPERDKVDRSSLRWIQSGAAPVPVTVIEDYMALGIEIHQVYGMTESGGPACLTSPQDAVEKVGSAGKAFFHCEVRVVDDAGNDVAPGEMGEVLISGPHIMKEYWNRPDATAETIVDGWVKSGDVASIDEDGCIYLQDRKKDMIISGGENVYPAEIENVLLTLDGVADAAVVGIPSVKWGESGLAVIVRSDEELAPQAVLDHCQGKLARFKQPVAVEFVDEIPRNPSGKILKRVLRERFPGPAPA